MLMPTQAHARTIIEKLRSRNESVSVAESLTGGGLGHELTRIPGVLEFHVRLSRHIPLSVKKSR